MGWETVEKVAAVSWEVPDSLGIQNSGATEGLKLYADTAWVLSLRCSGKFVSFRDLKGNLSMRLLAISSQFSVARSDSLAYFLSLLPLTVAGLRGGGLVGGGGSAWRYWSKFLDLCFVLLRWIVLLWKDLLVRPVIWLRGFGTIHQK